MTTEVGYCYQEHCRAAIYRLRYIDSLGAPAPIDAAPADNGNIVIDLEAGTYQVLTKDRHEAARAAGTPLHLNHWATCSDPPPRRAPKRAEAGAETSKPDRR